MTGIMKCSNCKKIIPDNVRFCPECGSLITTRNNAQIIHMRCKQCGGTMEVEEGQSVFKCQYCGSTQIIIDSDEVAKEKIKQSTKKEIELNRLKYQIDKEKREKEEKEADEFTGSKLRKWVIAFAVICLLFALISFSGKSILRGMVALVQTALFVASYLYGMNILKSERQNMHRLLALIGFLLIIVYIRTPVHKTVNAKTITTYTWPSDGLATYIPQPPTEFGEIEKNDASTFSISTYQVTDAQYKEYISACSKEGYTVEISDNSISHTAYNDEGYKLSLTYYSSWDELEIEVEAPMQLNTIVWPKSEAGRAVPEPESKVGKIAWEHEDSFLIYIGNTSIDDFLAYTYLCADNGYDKNYDRGEKYYNADNVSNHYHISIRYEGFNTMSIKVSKKD